jgi:hypothetical protein
MMPMSANAPRARAAVRNFFFITFSSAGYVPLRTVVIVIEVRVYGNKFTTFGGFYPT